jgi:hypothetical protein
MPIDSYQTEDSMIVPNDEPRVTIVRDDLAAVAEALTVRLPLRAKEAQRVARTGDLLAAMSQFQHAVAAYAQHAVVEQLHDDGAGDMIPHTEALYRALVLYATQVHEFAEAYRKLLGHAGQSPFDPSGGEADEPNMPLLS